MSTTRRPLQYQELAKILGPLPRQDQNYVLQFLLAAEKRCERRIEALEVKERELTRQQLVKENDRGQLDKIRVLGKILKKDVRSALKAVRKGTSDKSHEQLLTSLSTALVQFEHILDGSPLAPQA
jgi:hypothetical protein